MEQQDNQLLNEFKNIVGEEWASSDPELVFAYSRDVNLYPDNLRSVMRPPFIVVIPKTPEELQKIVIIAKKFKSPITIIATGINICGMGVPPMGGVLVDLKRMDQIISIDEDNCTATIQPYVSVARLSCELQKRGMYIPVPGCPSTAGIISNTLFGMGLKVNNRVGRQDESIVGFKMILPDGNLLKVGSGADPVIPKDFWPHGPGPDMYMLPMWAVGTTGIMTEMTIKCWLKGEAFKEIWVAYEDIDRANDAFVELSRMEICKGLNLYGGNKYTSYFTDTREAMERMIRANPEFQLVISLEGTERRIAFEEKMIRQVAEKTGGFVLADKFAPYKSFVESHAGMSGSMYSDYSMKYWGSRGTNWTTSSHPRSDQVNLQFRAYSEAVMADPEYSDPDFGHGEFWRSIIAYPFAGGHYYLEENGIDAHPGDPKWQSLAKRVGPQFPRFGIQKRLALPSYNKAPREGLPPYKTTLHRLARDVAKRLDPDGNIHAGVMFNY